MLKMPTEENNLPTPQNGMTVFKGKFSQEEFARAILENHHRKGFWDAALEVINTFPENSRSDLFTFITNWTTDLELQKKAAVEAIRTLQILPGQDECEIVGFTVDELISDHVHLKELHKAIKPILKERFPNYRLPELIELLSCPEILPQPDRYSGP